MSWESRRICLGASMEGRSTDGRLCTSKDGRIGVPVPYVVQLMWLFWLRNSISEIEPTSVPLDGGGLCTGGGCCGGMFSVSEMDRGAGFRLINLALGLASAKSRVSELETAFTDTCIGPLCLSSLTHVGTADIAETGEGSWMALFQSLPGGMVCSHSSSSSTETGEISGECFVSLRGECRRTSKAPLSDLREGRFATWAFFASDLTSRGPS